MSEADRRSPLRPVTEEKLAAPADTRRGAILCMLGVVLIWGVNVSVMKSALGEIPPLGFNALRFPLGTLALGLLVWRVEPNPWPSRAEWPKVVALGLLAHPLYQLIFLNGLAWTSASHTAILVGTTPIWVALADRFLTRERLPWAAWLGIFLSLAGVVLLVVARATSRAGHGTEGSSLAGDVLVLCSSVLWTAYVISSRPLLRTRSPLWLTGWTFFAGAPVVVAMGLPTLARHDWSGATFRLWGGVVFAGLFALATAYWWWAVGVKRLGASRTAVFSNLIPVVALSVAWVWLGETLSPLAWLGAAVVLAGIWMTTSSRARGSRPR